MQYGDFYYPIPANEPVLNYAPGSAEKKRLKEYYVKISRYNNINKKYTLY